MPTAAGHIQGLQKHGVTLWGADLGNRSTSTSTGSRERHTTMQKPWDLCFILLLVLRAITEAQQPPVGRDPSPAERRVALVIGNSAYHTAPLKNPVNDASDMAQALRELDFDVIYKENLNQHDMKRAIRAMGEQLRSSTVGLFYYAGHGVQVRGENYLVPVDATIESEEEVEYEGIHAGFVLAQMDSARNPMNIVILDACRNNPFARSFRSASRGLASMNAPSGTLIAYATAPGAVASDGQARNGLYTQELLKVMRTPGLGIEEVFKRVRIAVRAVTQGQQTPWESSSLVGDFSFQSPTPSEAPSPHMDMGKTRLPGTLGSVTGQWSGSWENTKGEQGTSTIKIREEASSVIQGDEDGWVIEHGRRQGHVLTWEYTNKHNGCRDYQVRLEIAENGNVANGTYEVRDRCENTSYRGSYNAYHKQ
jgi:caspase domain-containing protein